MTTRSSIERRLPASELPSTNYPSTRPSGGVEFDNFTGNDFKPIASRTIFEHLTEHGVSWRFYEHRYCSLRLFARYTTDNSFIVDADDSVKGFFTSARTGTLPSVSFIDPNFIDEADGQDHDDDDFKEVMRAMRSRYPVPK